MRSGWKTSEFWIALVSQLMVLLVLTGWIEFGDKEKLETALVNAITAVFTLIASATVVVRYIQSRTTLKTQVLQQANGKSVLPLALVLLLGLGDPAFAGPPVQPTCWRCGPRTDPQVLSILQQIAANQQQIMALLQQQRQTSPTPIIVLTPPAQQVPLGGPALQQIPLGGAPKQDVPLGGPPKQEIPPSGPPKQEVPLGPTPKPIESGPKPPPSGDKSTVYQRYFTAPRSPTGR